MRNKSVFEKYNIEHLSASSINQFVHDPSYWVFKVMGRNDLVPFDNSVGISAHVGTAVHLALQKNLDGHMHDNPAPYELRELLKYEWLEDKKQIEENNESPFKANDCGFTEKQIALAERNSGRMFYNAFTYYESTYLTEPLAIERKIEAFLGDVPIPFVGYLDFEYKNHVRDLKTGGRKVRTPSNDHQRQAAIYREVTNKAVFFDYVTPTEASPHQEIEMSVCEPYHNVPYIDHVLQIAKQMETYLSFSNDIFEVFAQKMPYFDHMYLWSEANKKAASQLLGGTTQVKGE